MEEKDKELAKEISEEVVKEIKKSMSKKSFGSYFGIIKDIITIVLIVVVVVFGAKIYNGIKDGLEILEPVEGHDLTISNKGLLGYIAVDFEEAILGTAKKEELIVVDEQEISVVTTTTQAGLFKLGIFSKINL